METLRSLILPRNWQIEVIWYFVYNVRMCGLCCYILLAKCDIQLHTSQFVSPEFEGFEGFEVDRLLKLLTPFHNTPINETKAGFISSSEPQTIAVSNSKIAHIRPNALLSVNKHQLSLHVLHCRSCTHM